MKKFTLNRHIANMNNMYDVLLERTLNSKVCQNKNSCDCRPLHENWIEPIYQLQLIQYISDLISISKQQTPLPKLLKLIEGDFHSLAGHNMRSAAIAVYTAAQLDFSTEEQKVAGLGALLHDIGKLVIPKMILDKPSYLTTEEFEIIKTHSEAGYCLLKNETWLPYESLLMVHNHHERLDGSGYPRGIDEGYLSKFDRIIAIADVFDAITSKRNYRPSLSYSEALAHLEKECPDKLDQRVYTALKKQITPEKPSRFVELSPQTQINYKRISYATHHG